MVHAVDRVDLAIRAGEVVGLVGESGCGSPRQAAWRAGLHSLTEGSRYWKGSIWTACAREKREKQLAIQMIFQDPYASLNRAPRA
ncbi:ATP-binding cassette domain-containing protein [Cupriavidus basilensis]